MQNLIWITPLLIILAIVAIAFFIRKSNRKLRSKIDSEFGRIPKHEDFDILTVNGYHHYASKENKAGQYIDNITWNDLNMDDVFKRIDNCRTSIGQEYLYHKLHEVCSDEDKDKEYCSLTEQFADEERRKDVQLYLEKLGKTNHSISSLVFEPKQYKLKLPSFVYTLLAALAVILIIISVVCISLSPEAASLFAILSFLNVAANIILYYTTKLKLENQLNMLGVFSGALWTCRKIIKSQADDKDGVYEKLNTQCAKLSFIRSRISRKARSATSEADYLKEFLFMMFLVDIRKYNKSIKKIISNREAVKYVYRSIGEIDVSINTLSFKKSLKQSCRPGFHNESRIEFEEVYHPLINEPVTNSGVFDSNIIVTGANASGKSTFIKAVAINNILAQTLNLCCAKSYTLRRSYVITSMAQNDDIIEGDSYYIAEIKSLKRILEKTEKVYCTCFIDEILRGTNTVERISASIAVIEYLNKANCLCMIATHDIELAEVFDKACENYHFEENVGTEDIEFDYKLKEGMATSRNAVKLLSLLEYPDEIINNANLRVKEYEQMKKWNDIE